MTTTTTIASVVTWTAVLLLALGGPGVRGGSLHSGTPPVKRDTPSIGFISPDVVADLGGAADLTCTIKNENAYPIMWMRLGTGRAGPLPISRGKELLITDKRFALTVDEDTSTYVLSISNIEQTDAASYQCQIIISTTGSISDDVQLKVKLPPTIKGDDLKVSQLIAEGSPANMLCEASGYPTPQISWAKADGALLPNGKSSFSGSRFIISKVRREDRGTYICTATNGVGQGQKKQVSLDVEFQPEVQVLRPRIPQAIDYEAHLTCDIESFPSPAILWFRDNVEIRNNDTFQISHFASADERTSTVLKVLKVTQDQFGVYRCQASNRIGSASQEMELYQSKMPICPPLCGTDLVAAAPFNLATSVPFVVFLQIMSALIL